MSKLKKHNLEALRKRVKAIIQILEEEYPDAKTALVHKNPFELLIATILSAQCTDERVNMVTPALFKRYPNAKAFAEANIFELESMIKSTGFYHAKAKNIINCCKVLVEKHSGKIPERIEDLVNLPGVGRKTANVVLGGAFGIASGIVVDTHVKRLAERLGLSNNSNPDKIEEDLMEIVPEKDWISFSDMLIWHGRRVCKAKKPKCLECSINNYCPSYKKFT
ncbi:MAG: Endonuclease III [Ignavibacteriae bacterium]|nr:MAG: Endonuclease III [Ignavibacteriota bacterium]